jgi:hypothetical protein
MKSLLAADREANLNLAFRLAEEHFGIPTLLDAQDLMSPNVDERSVMTYVGEYAYYFAHPELQKVMKEKRRSRKSNIVSTTSAATATNKNIVPNEVEDDNNNNNNNDDDDESSVAPPIEDVEVFDWDSLRMQGYLTKQDPSGWVKFWRRRWFLLLVSSVDRTGEFFTCFLILFSQHREVVCSTMPLNHMARFVSLPRRSFRWRSPRRLSRTRLASAAS